jgi:DNA repair protein SbcD/Mre11
VTVNDSLEVVNAEWQDLDVVRWRVLEINLAGVNEESEALGRVTQSMIQAMTLADGRLVAARIIFTGATPLHGSLHRETHRWRAELLARAQDQGQDAIWIERIQVSTSPVYELAELAQRDALTRIVLETLEQARVEPGNLPDEIKEMLGVLPGEIRSEVESDWTGDGSVSALEEVRAIILDALGTRGGQTP